jgi:hypothetical protein
MRRSDADIKTPDRGGLLSATARERTPYVLYTGVIHLCLSAISMSRYLKKSS